MVDTVVVLGSGYVSDLYIDVAKNAMLRMT
jgi:hypothetical protein